MLTANLPAGRACDWFACQRGALPRGELIKACEGGSWITGPDVASSARVAIAGLVVCRAAGGVAERRRRSRRSRSGSKWKSGPRSIPPLDPDPSKYDEELEKKAAAVRLQLAEHLGDVPLEVMASTPLHHRHRWKNRFFWLEDGGVAFKALDPETRIPVALFQCPYASDRINLAMRGLLECLNTDEDLRQGLGQAEFLSSSDGEVLVCLAWGRPLPPDVEERQLAPLLQQLGATGVVARSRRQRVHAGVDHLVQWHEVAGHRYPQWLQEAAFFQHNHSVCVQMLQWAERHTRPSEGAGCRGPDLLELYCGNGNFTLPLAANFRFVLAGERDKRVLRAARHCAAEQGLENLAIMRLSAEEMAEALSPEGRTFRRLKEAGVDLAACDFGTALANPPREGLSRAAAGLLRGIQRVIYVSCSPKTLARDLERLPDHRVTAAALFDQFPFTKHAEVGLVLEQP